MLPVALLPDLLELEANLPADPTTFFAAAFDPSAPPAPGARAAAEVLRHAASQGLETADLMQQLRMLGLGEAGAIFFANYWAAQPSRASLQREPPLQLLDVDWSFGVSASSSEHQAMGTTFVQLRLSTQGQNGGEFVHTGAAVARPPLPRATRDSLSLSLSHSLSLSLYSESILCAGDCTTNASAVRMHSVRARTRRPDMCVAAIAKQANHDLGGRLGLRVPRDESLA